MPRPRPLYSLFIVALLAVSCGGPGPVETPMAPTATTAPTPTPEPAPELIASAEISAADGGLLASEDGRVSLEIPPGALAADTTISLSVLPPELQPEDMQGLEPSGPVYRLEPDGLQFSTPATLTVPLDPMLPDADGAVELPLGLALSRGADGTWAAWSATLTASAATGESRLAIEIRHLSDYFDWKILGLWVRLTPREVRAMAGGTWVPLATVTNNYDAALNVVAVGVASVGEPVERVRDLQQPGLPFPLDSGATAAIDPEAILRCAEPGEGDYEFALVADIDLESNLRLLRSLFLDDVALQIEAEPWLASRPVRIVGVPVVCTAPNVLELKDGAHTVWTGMDTPGDTENQTTMQPAPPEVQSPDIRSGSASVVKGQDGSTAVKFEIETVHDFDALFQDAQDGYGVIGFGKFVGGPVPYEYFLGCTWYPSGGGVTHIGHYRAADGSDAFVEKTLFEVDGRRASCTVPVPPEIVERTLLPFLSGEPGAPVVIMEAQRFENGKLWYDWYQSDLEGN